MTTLKYAPVDGHMTNNLMQRPPYTLRFISSFIFVKLTFTLESGKSDLGTALRDIISICLGVFQEFSKNVSFIFMQVLIADISERGMVCATASYFLIISFYSDNDSYLFLFLLMGIYEQC